MSFNTRNLKVNVLLILTIIFIVLTFIGAYMVLTHKLDNAGYCVIPMLFTLIFSSLYRENKK